jgi:protein-disulfide isomerase
MAGQKSFYMVLGAIAVAGAAWLGVRTLGAPDLPVRAAQGTPDASGFQGYILGSADAPVEVVEYADYQCPACAGFDQVQWPDIKARLVDTGKMRLRYRDYPLDEIHPHARLAAHAAACADDQGRFWQMKDRLYARQNDWAYARGEGKAYDVLADVAGTAGLDVGAWKGCMESGSHAARIEASHAEALRIGAPSTPTFLINGRIYAGMNAEELVGIVDSLIATQGAASE